MRPEKPREYSTLWRVRSQARQHSRIAVGLGTGNIEGGARIKLARVALNENFPFGGFGSDHEDRAELLAVGAARGAARLALPRSACRVVVIGDTPKDIAAAHAIDAESLAVATGPFPVDILRDAGATIAVPNLADPQAPRFLFSKQ